MSGRTRLTGREQPSPSLVQNWLKRLEASPDGSDVNHYVRISAPAVEARQFPDSFVAFLSVSRFFPADSLVLAQALRAEPLHAMIHRPDACRQEQPLRRVDGEGGVQDDGGRMMRGWRNISFTCVRSSVTPAMPLNSPEIHSSYKTST
jgi:hypothetical protein